jgi:hypothetical protein
MLVSRVINGATAQVHRQKLAKAWIDGAEQLRANDPRAEKHQFHTWNGAE